MSKNIFNSQFGSALPSLVYGSGTNEHVTRWDDTEHNIQDSTVILDDNGCFKQVECISFNTTTYASLPNELHCDGTSLKFLNKPIVEQEGASVVGNIPEYSDTTNTIIDSGYSITDALAETTIVYLTFNANAGTPSPLGESVPMYLTKIGNLIFFSIQQYVDEIHGVNYYETPVGIIPPDWRPSFRYACTISPLIGAGVSQYNADVCGLLQIDTSGKVKIYKEPEPGSGVWDDTNCGWDMIGGCYY